MIDVPRGMSHVDDDRGSPDLCWNCGGHPIHLPGQCAQMTLFTKKRCECPGR